MIAFAAHVPDLTPVVSPVLNARLRVPPARALLVGISGIDASGKGYVAARLADVLRATGLTTEVVGADAWLNLPSVRFSEVDPGGHFYRYALRLDEMFERLVLPLKRNRAVDVEANVAEETATEFRRHRYRYRDVDVVLVEGIFLFRPPYRAHFDVAAWIDCSFETAQRRAIVRGQEGLPPAETVAAFERIYVPAQRLHFDLDQPAAAADITIRNDPARS